VIAYNVRLSRRSASGCLLKAVKKTAVKKRLFPMDDRLSDDATMT